MARLAVPILADWCLVDVVAEDGSIRRLAMAHKDPSWVELAWEVERRHPLDPGAKEGVPKVIRTGQAELHPEVHDSFLVGVARNAEHLKLLRKLGLKSAMIVPLVARGWTLGAISFGSTGPERRYGKADLALAEDLTRRAALAVDNARLYEEAERRRREAEVVAELARTINASLDLDIILRRAASAVQELCRSDTAQVALRDPESDALTVHYWIGIRATTGDRIRVEAGMGLGGLVLATGRPVRTDDYATDPRLSKEHLAEVQKEGFVAAIAAPIRGEDGVEGVLYAVNRSPRRFTDRDEATLLRLAEHAAIAIRNVRLFAREQAARAEAQEANRAKDEFLATVSHELRAPLNAILGWAQVLRAGRRDEATLARALETIERNARVQAQLIADLLDVSRVITGKLSLEIVPLDLVPVIEAALDAMRPTAAAKGIQLESILDLTVDRVSGDPARLQQVFWNLLSNAIKFTQRGGRVEVRLEREDAHIRITVTDSGQGIHPDFLPYVFDRFRQADSGTTRSHGGLGLGLAIVRHLVELHGGTVQADSRGEGQGATFTVRLPILAVRGLPRDSEGRPAGGTPLFDNASALDGVRVLVVDDEADVREFLTTLLELCGASVAAAASANEALDALARVHPDVLVTDVGMPGEDGYALIRKVRALPSERGGKIPALALTAYASGEDRLRALSAGFQIHLPKPVEPGELTRVIAALVGRAGA